MRAKPHLFPIAFLLLLAPFLMADVGPKPSAMFEIEYTIDPIPELTDYLLLECKDPDCVDNYPLEKLGPQHFDCTQGSCSSIAYGYAEYMQIVFTFSDGVTRTSNIFTKNHFDAEYLITVQTEDLLVEETGGSGNPAITFLAVVLAVICLLVLVFAWGVVLIVRAIRKKRRGAAESPADS